MNCTECNEDVTELRLYVLEENKYHLDYNPEMASPDWSASEVVEGTAEKMIAYCGHCDSKKPIGTWSPGFVFVEPDKKYWEINYVEWIEHLLEIK